jgi:hypothetical protein
MVRRDSDLRLILHTPVLCAMEVSINTEFHLSTMQCRGTTAKVQAFGEITT